jgi:hemerythrin superfamily protein
VTELSAALEYWKHHWLPPMPPEELSHRDEAEKIILDVARRWESLDSEETKEALAQVLYDSFDVGRLTTRKMADAVVDFLKDSPDV